MKTISIGRSLTVEDVYQVAHHRCPAVLDSTARSRLRDVRKHLVQQLASGAVMYGVNTGFGALSEQRISTHQIQHLQANLLRSHAVGVGPLLSIFAIRALLLLRAHTLALGACGASAELVEYLLTLLNKDIVPIVPSQGSVGASGDLAPLAHLALVILGEGEVWFLGERMPAKTALEQAQLPFFQLGPKEGLSLINGTQLISALGSLAIWDSCELMTAADILGSLSLDASLGSVHAFDVRIHAGKPFPGQQRSAAIVRCLLEGSPLNASHANCGVVQDAYSLRCIPQVHGAVRSALLYAAHAAHIEINSFTDNPLVLARADGGYDIHSGGNFHGASLALPLDHLTAALTTLATISERRLDRLLNPQTSRGLTAFLANDPGLESGYMMAQVTAAALASECKNLSLPASIDTIPTSAGKEDHVSMGPLAARKLQAVIHNLAHILAIEAAIAARAIDLRGIPTSERLTRVYQQIRRYIPPFTGDRSMSQELGDLAQALLRGELREAAQLEHELAATESAPLF